MRNKGKGVKRERDEDENGGVIEIVSDDDNIENLQVMHITHYSSHTSDVRRIQDELKRLQDRISRKKAKKFVKPEPADDIIDLT